MKYRGVQSENVSATAGKLQFGLGAAKSNAQLRGGSLVVLPVHVA
jgi:hypothetical protein